MKHHILTIVLAFTISFSFAQETATVFIARKGLWSTSGAMNTFMDGKIICEVNNKHYGKLHVAPGQHTFHAQWTGKKSADSAKKHEVVIDMKAGQEYYLQLVKQDKGVWSYIHVEEVTANTWKNLQEGLKEDTCH